MARDESPPFERGATFYGGRTIDSNNLLGVQHEGVEYEFEDLDYAAGSGTGAKPTRTGRKVKCRCVRNVAAAALLPKRLATLKAGDVGRVNGYATIEAAANAFPIDEFLPAAGVPVNDLFWIVVGGPALVQTGLAADEFNVINLDDLMIALTAVTSGSTTSGRVKTAALTGATAVLGVAAANIIGRALSAKTTGNTNVDLLIDVFKRW